ncbi:ribosome biogenesis protein SLX9-domain-containing protein [Xylariaceae sp. FL1272]|nr:ribosome biogenesis protein SLX9-domain-containing protein [Xylariaceae sp. FL1272]
MSDIMAPTAPAKRRSLRAKLAAKSGPEPHAPRKAGRPDAVAPSVDGFTSTKKDKRTMKHSVFVSRIEKANRKPLKRRRPSKKLVTNLESLADALPDLLANGETEEGLKQLREGKIRHKSLKSGGGALKKKEKIVRGEMNRFGQSLSRLNAVGAQAAAGAEAAAQTGQVDLRTQAQAQNSASTASRFAALRGFIGQTMEQHPAFVRK